MIVEMAMTPLGLHTAASTGDAEKIVAIMEKCLVADRPVQINAFNIHGFTPLQAAVFHDQPKAIEALLLHGASVRLPANRPQYTFALHLAALRGNLKSVRMLLNAGADPYLMDWDGMRAADVAAGMGHKAVVTLLRQHMEALKDHPSRGFPMLMSKSSFNRGAEDWWWRVRRVEVQCDDPQPIIDDHYSDGGSPAALTLHHKQEQQACRPICRAASMTNLAQF